jgi:glycosyltransferase involved in cell wall biosynthesis
MNSTGREAFRPPEKVDDLKKLVSVITPCLNEESNVEDCYLRVQAVMKSLESDFDYEHIFCDNASTDETLSILETLAAKDSRVKVIENSRNFGPFNSMFNGLLASNGDLVVPFLPADCQDPPEVIPELVDAWKSGAEIVYGVRSVRQESWLLRFFRSRYYKLVNRWSSISIPMNVGEFGLIERKVVDSLREVEDYYPYVRGLIANTGFRSQMVKYTWVSRKRGISKNNTYALIDQALNGIISFTNIPTRLLLFLGAVISTFAFLYSLLSLVVGLVWYGQIAEPGILTLIVAVFFFSGVIIFSLGVIGEYVSAIHSQVRRRPLVTERRRINFN